MKNTYTIKDLITLLWNHLIIIIAITICGGIAAFAFSKFVLPLQYSSHITMYVQSYTGISESANNQNNISNSKQLVNTYMEVLKDDAVMNAVGDLLTDQYGLNEINNYLKVNEKGKIDPSSIRNCLAISSVTDTSAVKIVATTTDPGLAANICNDLTQVAPKYVEEAVGVGSINTIDVAKVYNTPVAPNNTKNAILGMAGAFLLVVMIILIIDYFDNAIKESDKISKKYNKAIIGEIQQFGESRIKKKTNLDEDLRLKLTDKDVPFYIVESYKSIRTNITFALSTAEKKIFAVSSANPGEGKSTTSANIAIAIAQGGSKVLLIDADMRKSVQHKIFKLKNKKGLSSAISKMSNLDDCIQKNVMENLDVMTRGPVPPNPSELLASDNMGTILEELNKKYDVILIDTPPVNVVTDAMELAKNISGIILVFRYGRTTYEEADIAYKKIEFAKMNLLGFILNCIKTKKAGYYSKYNKSKYYYKKGYGYGYGYYGSKPETDEDDSDESEDNLSVKKTTEETKKEKPAANKNSSKKGNKK